MRGAPHQPARRLPWITRRRVALILKLTVSVIALTLMLRMVSPSVLAQTLADAELSWLVLAVVIFWLAQLASAQRYVYICQTLKRPVAFNLSLRLHFIGLFFNQVLPTSLGGDIIKIILLRPIMGTSIAFRSTMLDRASGLIFLLGSIVLLLPLYAHLLPTSQQTLSLALVSGSALLSIGVVTYFSPKLLVRVFRWRVAREMMLVLYSLRAFARWRPLSNQLWTSGIVHLNGIVSYALVGKALGVSLSIVDYILIVPLVFLVALLPISFAGWGVRELGALWLFGLVGLPAAQASTMSVLFGLMLMVAGLPALAMLPSGIAMSGIDPSATRNRPNE